MALLIIALQYHEYHTLKPENLILWISLPWCITIFGAIFAAVGTHYATPTSHLPSTDEKSQSLTRALKNLMKNAWIINAIAVALPALISLTVAVPTFIANSYFQKANHLHDRWEDKYSSYTMFTQDMVTEAQIIWFTLLRSTFIASATFCLWFFWASFCFVISTLLSLRLMRTIREELSRSNMVAPNFVVTQTRMVTSNHALQNEVDLSEAAKPPPQVHSTPYKAQGRRKLPKGDHSYFAQSTNSFPSQVRTPKDAAFHELQRSNESQAGWYDGVEVPMTGQTTEDSFEPNQGHPSDPLVEQSPTNKKLLKKLIPNLVMTAEKAQNSAVGTMISSRDEQKRELRKASMHIFTQFAIVSPGCAAFGAIALMMGLVLHGSFEQPHNGGTKFEFFGAVALLVVMYVVSFFGWVCAGAIFHRTYEPVFVNYSATATFSSFGFSGNCDRRTIDLLRTIDSSSSKLQDFIRVGGADPRVRNKIRYPQALVRSMLGNPSKKIERINSKQSSSQSSYEKNSSPHSHFPIKKLSFTQDGQHQPKRAIYRQYSDMELRESERKYKSIKKKQSDLFDVKPKEGELVNNSVMIIRKEKNTGSPFSGILPRN